MTDYVASTNDGTFGSWGKSYVWLITPTSGSTQGSTPGQGTPQYSPTWVNAVNSPVRKVKVTVRWTNPSNSSQFHERTDERVVTIKHIAPIISMSITGGFSANPSNGGTVTVPCGVINLTVTVPTPVTDPMSPVTYTWQKPSGWTGSSTTNTINLTTNTGANDGTIVVSAKRSDGNVFRTYTVNINRPQVDAAIITDINWYPWTKPLCSGESRQLSGSSSLNATTFVWTKTGGTNIVSGANTATVTINGTTNGYLNLAASNACGVTKNTSRRIYAGVPQINTSADVIVDGHPNAFPSANITTGSSYITMQNESNCQTYKWELFGGSGFFTPNGNCSGCLNSFNGINFFDCGHGSISTSSNMVLRLRSANRCGQGVDVIIPFEIAGGGYYSMVSSNPTSDLVIVEFEPQSAVESLMSVALVSNINAEVVRTKDFSNAQSRTNYFGGSNRVEFNVNDLDPGAYFLVMRFAGIVNKVYKELIIVG